MKNDNCSICLEPMINNLEKLKCNHYLHKHCYETYIINNREKYTTNYKEKDTLECPICRLPVIDLDKIRKSNINDCDCCLLGMNIFILILFIGLLLKLIYDIEDIYNVIFLINLIVISIIIILQILYLIFVKISFNICIIRLTVLTLICLSILSNLLFIVKSYNNKLNIIILFLSIISTILVIIIHSMLECKRCIYSRIGIDNEFNSLTNNV